jgi:hypothetical protein
MIRDYRRRLQGLAKEKAGKPAFSILNGAAN